jgi:hypothetical protein
LLGESSLKTGLELGKGRFLYQNYHLFLTSRKPLQNLRGAKSGPTQKRVKKGQNEGKKGFFRGSGPKNLYGLFNGIGQNTPSNWSKMAKNGVLRRKSDEKRFS